MKIRCLDNTGYEVSLVVGKLYEIDTEVAGTVGGKTLSGVYVIDESGESYWYPASMFNFIGD